MTEREPVGRPSLVALSLRSRATVFFLAFALAMLGLSAYLSLPRERYPDIQVPLIFVQVAYPGAAPLEVEKQITRPLERELTGLAALQKIESESEAGLALLTVEFASGTDVDLALQKVRDRVDLAKIDFPDEAEEPYLQEINFSEVPVLQIHISGDVGAVVLKELAEDLQDEIETLPGVLRAALAGGREREVQVDVDPRTLVSFGLALDDVVDAVADEHVAIPGGDLDLGSTRYAVRVPGEAKEPLDVADLAVKTRDGRSIKIRDVAEVRFGFEEQSSISRIAAAGAVAKDSVAIQVQKRVGANIIEVVEESKATVKRVRDRWPAGVEVVYLGDQSLDIHQQVRDLENSILSGLLLVLGVLMFALGLRNAFFVALAIPLSMMLTFAVLQLSGLTLNTVVLFSLVLAVGMLVDNAVVVIENIYRHMQEGMTGTEAARVATEEVGGAIAVSTLTTVGAFLPLIFWPGIIGDFMSYLPLTVCIALMASLAVAFTFNPVLCSALMRARLIGGKVVIHGDTDEGDDGVDDGPVEEPNLFDRLGARVVALYRAGLEKALDHRAVTLAGTLVFLALIVVTYIRFNHGTELISEERPSTIKVDIDMPPGTRIERTDEVARLLEGRLNEITDLRVLATSVGEGSQSDDFGDSGPTPGAARLTLDLVPGPERRQDSYRTLAEVREAAGVVPGASLDIDKLEDGLPVGPPLAIEVTGDDFAVLGEIAARIRREIANIDGLVTLQDDFDSARPELIVRVDREQTARLGLTMKNIAGTVRTAVNGEDAATFRRGDEEIDIVVRLAESSRSSIADIENLRVVTPDGQQVPLGTVATVRRDFALESIRHKNRRRMVTVTGEVAEPNLAEPVRTEALARLARLDDLLAPGYALNLSGQKEDEDEAREFLSQAFLWALVLVMALMVGKFDSIAVPGIILTSVALSMCGVLIGLLITGLPFSIVLTGVGVISLAGIVVNNAIVLLDYAEQQRRAGLPRREAVITTGVRRLRPVLLTAITTILGLLPLTAGFEFDFRSLTLSTDSESSDYWRSMGVAVIFGLAFATFLTLIIVPVLYDMLWGLRDRVAAWRSRGSAVES